MTKRWVVTHINKDGDRVLAFAQQGRFTHQTRREAQAVIDAMLTFNANDRLASLYGLPLEPRLVECWPGHFDPKGIYAPDETDETIDARMAESGWKAGRAPKGAFPQAGKAKPLFEATGEYRVARKDDWFLSGSIVEAYKGPSSDPMWIARRVDEAAR